MTLNKRNARSHPKKRQLPGFQRETHLVPGIPKVVAIGVSHCNKRLYGVNVFLLHFCDAGAGCKQGEASKSLNIGISFQLQHKPRREQWDPCPEHHPLLICGAGTLASPMPSIHLSTSCMHINMPVIPCWCPPVTGTFHWGSLHTTCLRTSPLLSKWPQICSCSIPFEGSRGSICWMLRLSPKF